MWSGREYYTFHVAKWNTNLLVKKYWRTYFSVIRGPEDSLYKGGMYHGKLVFPSGTWSVQDLRINSIFPLRISLQAAFNIYDNSKWQVKVNERFEIFLWAKIQSSFKSRIVKSPSPGSSQTHGCASPSQTITQTPGTPPGLLALSSQVWHQM